LQGLKPARVHWQQYLNSCKIAVHLALELIKAAKALIDCFQELSFWRRSILRLHVSMGCICALVKKLACLYLQGTGTH
jgi:hypothetical protein